MDDSLYKNLLVELECPVCFNYMAPPILQCTKGHSICESCRGRLRQCPLCASEFAEARNLALEALAARIQYPCTNDGCPAKLTLTNRDYHQKNCGFRKYRCGIDTCSWTGPPNEIMKHWESKQLGTKPYRANNLCHTKVLSGTTFVNLVNANNEIYYFKCKILNGMIYFAVQYIGQPEKAESFYYEIEVFKPGHPKRRLLLGDYCQHAHVEDDVLFQSGGCSFISVSSLDNYIGVDKMMIYNLRVHSINFRPQQRQQNTPPAASTNPFLNTDAPFPVQLHQQSQQHRSHSQPRQFTHNNANIPKGGAFKKNKNPKQK